MTLAEVVLGIMFVGLIAYALFAGADFGAGIWDLLAGGTQGGARQRAVIEHAIGPVWEANHVWLIFVLVVLWTGFPAGFTPVASTLYAPLTIAAFGMIARGAAFAFRKSITTLPMRRLLGAAFAVSSPSWSAPTWPPCSSARTRCARASRTSPRGSGSGLWAPPRSPASQAS